MQIQCHNCRHHLTVHPQGGQFQCPTCGAINAVGAPIPQGIPVQTYYNAPPPPVQHYQTPPAPKKDNRRAFVLGAFMVLGFVGLMLGWWGVLLGLPLLGWGIAGAMGKVKSLGALIFPESATKVGVTAIGIALGGLLTTCSAMGGVSQQKKAEQDARKAEAKAEQEAVAKADREKREADEAAAKVVRDAELRANVSTVAAAYEVGLGEVEAAAAEGKMRDADKKLKAVSATVEEYLQLKPVPEEISTLTPRHTKVAAKIADAVTILDAADTLDNNMSKASELTKGSKDGASWKDAQALWTAGLKNLETLENATETQKPYVPEGLAAKRQAIEAMLEKAEDIVAQYELELAARAAFQEMCGPEGCIEVSARDLLAEYENNEVGAQSRWKGKRVAVSGVVDSIGLDLFDEPFVTIKGSNQRFALQTVHCQPKNEQAATRLSKGQAILAIGTVGTEVIGSVMLDDCVF